MLTGDNGILTQAQNAKMETIVAGLKEEIQLSQVEATMQKKKVTPETLLAEGKVTRTVQAGYDDKYYMYYALKDCAYDGMQGLGKGNAASLRDVFLIDDDLNLKYIASNGKEYGDELNNKILDDETQIRFSSPAFSAYVSSISGVTEENMKFKWMKNQTSLKIEDPSVDSLADLVFFPNLKSLSIVKTKVTSMSGVENCSKLETLYINDGLDIADYTEVSKLANLTSFTRYNGNDFDNYIEVLKLCSNLKTLWISNKNGVNMKKISALTQLESLGLSGNKIQEIEGLNNLTKLKLLNLSNNQLTTTKGIEDLINLESLYLYNNQIETIEGMEKLTKLTRLELQNNQISDITPLKGNTALTYLDLRNNPSIDGNRANYTGDKLTALEEIGKILDRNGQISIDVDKIGLFNNYTTLDLSNQNLTTLDILEGMTSLTSLNISDNQITLEDEKSREILKSMTNLKSLGIYRNPLTDISAINSLKNLTNLNMSGINNINLAQIEDIISNVGLGVTTETFKTIVNCNPEKITSINAYNAGLKELPDLSKFTNLKNLSLGCNSGISNFDVISNIPSLENLTLNECNLHGRMINFSKLTNLKGLTLYNNSLWSEDLENLRALKNSSNLKRINLDINSIIDATALLDLNKSVSISLKSNINLSQDSKDKLKEHFGSNVSFDQ